MRKLLLTGILVGLASAQIMAFQRNNQVLFTTDSIIKASKCNDSQCPNYRIKLYFPRFSKNKYRRVAKKLNQEIEQAMKNLEKKFLAEVTEAYQDDPDTYAAYLSELSGSFEVYYNQNGLLSFTMDVDYTLPLGTGYPERYLSFYNYDLTKRKAITFGEVWVAITKQSTWSAFLKNRVKGTENSTQRRGFAIGKEGVYLFFEPKPNASHDETTHEMITYQTFERYFKLRSAYQFLKKIPED